MDLRPLGSTGIPVSPLGLGTVKFGRNQQVKYPRAFDLPSDATIADLLLMARELGINLLDTAPAYGGSEQRLGRLLPGPRDEWVIVTKVGETFEHGQSRFDFSAKATRASVERSLRRLHTDYLDVVLIHSDGEDERILDHEPVLETLNDLKAEGLIRAHGFSSKTVSGGLRAAELCDVLMVTYNPVDTGERPVLDAAGLRHKGVLVKKGLRSGHVAGADGVLESLRFVFAHPAVSSLVVGTINPDHLRANVAALHRVIEG